MGEESALALLVLNFSQLSSWDATCPGIHIHIHTSAIRNSSFAWEDIQGRGGVRWVSGGFLPAPGFGIPTLQTQWLKEDCLVLVPSPVPALEEASIKLKGPPIPLSPRLEVNDLKVALSSLPNCFQFLLPKSTLKTGCKLGYLHWFCFCCFHEVEERRAGIQVSFSGSSGKWGKGGPPLGSKCP